VCIDGRYVSEPSQKTWKYWDCEFPVAQYNPSFVFKYRSQGIPILTSGSNGVIVSLEFAGVLPRTFPKNMDVETVDLSTVNPDIRVDPPLFHANMQGRVEEMQWIVDNVNKQRAYKAACKQFSCNAELEEMLERRRQAYEESFSQASSKDPLANYPRWRY